MTDNEREQFNAKPDKVRVKLGDQNDAIKTAPIPSGVIELGPQTQAPDESYNQMRDEIFSVFGVTKEQIDGNGKSDVSDNWQAMVALAAKHNAVAVKSEVIPSDQLKMRFDVTLDDKPFLVQMVFPIELLRIGNDALHKLVEHDMETTVLIEARRLYPDRGRGKLTRVGYRKYKFEPMKSQRTATVEMSLPLNQRDKSGDVVTMEPGGYFNRSMGKPLHVPNELLLLRKLRPLADNVTNLSPRTGDILVLKVPAAISTDGKVKAWERLHDIRRELKTHGVYIQAQVVTDDCSLELLRAKEVDGDEILRAME